MNFGRTGFFWPAAAVLSIIGCAHGRPAVAEPAAPGPSILSDPGIAEEVYLPDFSYAGYGFGVGEIPAPAGREIRVDAFGAAPDDGKDDSKAVLEAIAAARSTDGPVVIHFSRGRYLLSEILFIDRSDIVLRGEGPDEEGTTLYFARPLRMVDETDRLDELRQYIRQLDKRQVDEDRNLDVFFSEYSWSGGLIWVQAPAQRAAAYLKKNDRPAGVLAHATQGSRGARSLAVSDASELEPGRILQIQWFNREGPDGALIDAIYNDSAIEVGSHHWNFPNRPLVVQTTQVLRVDGNRIVIADPLLHDVDARLPAKLVGWNHLHDVGIENFRIVFPQAPNYGHHVEEGFNGIYYTGVFNGWIRNLEIENADSGILTYNSANVTIEDVTTTGEHKAHYSVHIGNVHNVLVKNLKVRNDVIHSLSFNTNATRSVYTGAEVFVAPVLDQHAGANHQNLFDDITLHLSQELIGDDLSYPIFNGSGASYWQPGHGAFNTSWNIEVIVDGAEGTDRPVLLTGLDEGPDARIVGLHGNRTFRLDYRPEPYVERLNDPMIDIPSLYEFQRNRRLAASDRPPLHSGSGDASGT